MPLRKFEMPGLVIWFSVSYEARSLTQRGIDFII